MTLIRLLPRSSARWAPLGLLLALTGAGPAAAAVRYASPSGASTACTSGSPCSLATAVNNAAAGDEVVVAPGDYALGSSYLNNSLGINVHGVVGQPRPHITGSGTTALLTLKAPGSRASHLYLGNGGAGSGLELQGGVGDDLILVSSTGDAGKLVGSPAGTVLRDSVARALPGSSSAGAGIKVTDGSPSSTGPVDLRNVTTFGDGATGEGVTSIISTGRLTLRNVIAHGVQDDLDASHLGSNLTVSYSNFRPAYALGITDGGSNQSAPPVLADPANGDFHELSGSPTVDAGTLDSLVGAADPDGLARSLGNGPDIGAFELNAAGSALVTGTGTGSGTTSSGTTSDTTATVDDPAAPIPTTVVGANGKMIAEPHAGKTVNVAPAKGTVLVKLPGATSFVTLAAGVQVPVGATFDTRAGTVRLVSARDATETEQAGVFSGAVFTVRQDATTQLATVLALRGGAFGQCTSATARSSRAVTAARRWPGKHVVRSLWARDKGGRFRTDGRYASALVRGTVWLTQDRCDGTLVKVAKGKVAVTDKVRHTTTLVRAGRSYLAKRG